MNKKRVIFTGTGLHIREAGTEGGESRIIEGCAIVFDKEAVLYEDPGYYRELEKILPSCITQEFLNSQDIKMNLLHERDTTLARCKNGQGSLNLEIRPDGLYFSFEAPKCDLGDRALALVANDTYTGCSFEFCPGDYEIIQRNTGDDGKAEEYVVIHSRLQSLTALTIAMDPAYDDTTVSIREEYNRLHGGKTAKRLHKQQEREAKIRENRKKLIKTFNRF